MDGRRAGRRRIWSLFWLVVMGVSVLAYLALMLVGHFSVFIEAG
jgi:hypothetical protein